MSTKPSRTKFAPTNGSSPPQTRKACEVLPWYVVTANRTHAPSQMSASPLRRFAPLMSLRMLSFNRVPGPLIGAGRRLAAASGPSCFYRRRRPKEVKPMTNPKARSHGQP
jgi:hypothetical protein